MAEQNVLTFPETLAELQCRFKKLPATQTGLQEAEKTLLISPHHLRWEI